MKVWKNEKCCGISHRRVFLRCYPLNFSGSEVRSRDLDASKQKSNNVPLASEDVHGVERLLDEPKECLPRGLRRDDISPQFPSEENTEWIVVDR